MGDAGSNLMLSLSSAQMFSSKDTTHFGHSSSAARKSLEKPESPPLFDPVTKKWRGDTVFSVLTSSGDNYQNYQTRIL